MSRARVFRTREEAEEYIRRPMPEWVARERSLETERMTYRDAYMHTLSDPLMRQMRRDIQMAYADACEVSRCAAMGYRAAVMSAGRRSVMGRDIGDVRQAQADRIASDADEAWARHCGLCTEYEAALEALMIERGIPVGLYRSAVNRAEA